MLFLPYVGRVWSASEEACNVGVAGDQHAARWGLSAVDGSSTQIERARKAGSKHVARVLVSMAALLKSLRLEGLIRNVPKIDI